MDSSVVNKRINTNPINSETPCKVKKIDDQNVQTPDLQQMQQSHHGLSSLSLSQSIDNKMSNIAKLRQQFVEEVKSIELSQKESIKSLKQKIIDANQKVKIFTTKLKEANEYLCNQSEIIYKKEEENKVLRDKVAELFGYQKILYENMEAITNILSTHEGLSNDLANEYDHVMIIQDNDTTTLEENLRKLIPDEKLLTELDELNLKINELEREIIEYETKGSQLESILQEIRIEKENEQKHIDELDRKISELEAKNNTIKENASHEKSKLLNDVQKLDQEINEQVLKKQEFQTQNSELKQKIEINKCKEQKIMKQIAEANTELNVLVLETANLNIAKSKNEQKNKDKVDKLKKELNAKQTDLVITKNSHMQAINILQKKISELQQKCKCYDGVEFKLQKVETEISKEEELHLNTIKSHDEHKKQLADKIKCVTEKMNDSKLKLSRTERDISEAEGKIRLLEKEIREINEKYETRLKLSEASTEKLLLSQSFKQYELPNLFMSEALGQTDKQKYRKKLFTPTLADNDLDIDSLTLEEQVTHLTQVPASSPEKTRKFFKHVASSQPKAKKENTPKGRGRGKKL
ncbi:uncharacterized protein LOC131664689 [Phymastichus coffea]|uniref:uncharacterized protein LOC131664689 n=1 Tax=Phymastichus coffea TaxID=108790 RepID=UPI00273C2114|nr:uncharacterized protein LOC131664689 [Phymastichus coffea]